LTKEAWLIQAEVEALALLRGFNLFSLLSTDVQAEQLTIICEKVLQMALDHSLVQPTQVPPSKYTVNDLVRFRNRGSVEVDQLSAAKKLNLVSPKSTFATPKSVENNDPALYASLMSTIATKEPQGYSPKVSDVEQKMVKSSSDLKHPGSPVKPSSHAIVSVTNSPGAMRKAGVRGLAASRYSTASADPFSQSTSGRLALSPKKRQNENMRRGPRR
jgi:hypothetical protein